MIEGQYTIEEVMENPQDFDAVYDELGDSDPVRIPVEDATNQTRIDIRHILGDGEAVSDKEALEEFMVIHWAWFEKHE